MTHIWQAVRMSTQFNAQPSLEGVHVLFTLELRFVFPFVGL